MRRVTSHTDPIRNAPVIPRSPRITVRGRLRRRGTSAAFGWLVLIFVVLLPRSASAQDTQRYTVELRGVTLDDALDRFVDLTGRALSYDPVLTRGVRTHCVAENVGAEDVLRCILRGTRLDFYRLSSGTYVVDERIELPALTGYLAGRVTDGESGRPIPDAHVWLASADVGVVTNRAGQFVFPPLVPGRYDVVVSHVAYRVWQDTLQVEAGSRIDARAALVSRPVQSTPIVVDAVEPDPAFERLQTETVAADAAGLDALGGGGGWPGLRTVPGVRINDATADLLLQGGEAGELQVRLDGVPVFLPRRTIGILGPFSTLALDRVTVHKAGFGVEAGSLISGVVEAEHAVEDRNAADVQADRLGLNARAQLHGRLGARTTASGMAAVRLGLWGLDGAPRVQDLLDHWSRPDPYLVLAPVQDRLIPLDVPVFGPGGGRNAYDVAQEALRTRLAARPSRSTLDYADLHAAGRLRFGQLRTLSASVYQGENRTRGGLLGADRQNFSGDNQGVRLISVFDDYQWLNRTGQVRYDAVVGGRTMVGLQARASRYRLDHRYQLLDSLAVWLLDTRPIDSLDTVPTTDANRVSSYALTGRLDYAAGRHQLGLNLEAEATESRFDLLLVAVPSTEIVDVRQAVSVDRGRIRESTSLTRFTAAASDRIALARGARADVGLRLTALHGEVYAEPRAAVRLDGRTRGLGAWTAQTAGGLYRQFVTQHDVSSLNAGSLLPSVRIWLPADGTVRPPLAWHLSQAVLLVPRPGLTLRGEAFAKWLRHGLTLNYALPVASLIGRQLDEQQSFLADTRGATQGAVLGVEWEGGRTQAGVRYLYTRTWRQSDALFQGRRETVPWNEPHRLETSVQWAPVRFLSLGARGQGVWGRTWGFRQAYYDYFGHRNRTRLHGDFDLGDPSAHRLPALLQLDLNAALTVPIGPTSAQFRVDVLNATDRLNILDWRLAGSDDNPVREPRYLYPRLVFFAARVHW